MKSVKLLRRSLVVALAALLVFSLSFPAFAEDNGFSFELDRSFKIKEISISSAGYSSLSLKTALEWDLSGASGKNAAESIAYTLYLNEEMYAPEVNAESGLLSFYVTKPAVFALAESNTVESSSAYKINILTLDIPEGAKLRTELWQEDSSDKDKVEYISCGSCLVKDGAATMTIGKKMVQELEKGKTFKAVIYYDYEGYYQFVTEHEFTVVDPNSDSKSESKQSSGWTPPQSSREEGAQGSADAGGTTGLMPWEQDWEHDWQGSLENTLDAVSSSDKVQLPPWMDVDIIKQSSADKFGFHLISNGTDYSYGTESGYGASSTGESSKFSFSIEGITITIPAFWK